MQAAISERSDNRAVVWWNRVVDDYLVLKTKRILTQREQTRGTDAVGIHFYKMPGIREFTKTKSTRGDQGLGDRGMGGAVLYWGRSFNVQC